MNRIYEFAVVSRNDPAVQRRYIIEGKRYQASERKALALAAADGISAAKISAMQLLNAKDVLQARENQLIHASQNLVAQGGRAITIVEASCRDCGIIGSARGRKEIDCVQALWAMNWDSELTPRGYLWCCPKHSGKTDWRDSEPSLFPEFGGEP